MKLDEAMLISVYIPSKNRLDLLKAAIDSALGQTHREVEVIVVDDGSTDGTPAYLAGLAATDPRVRFIRHEQSKGGPAARNAAIEAARGEFVTGLDDDDTFEPDRLETFVTAWNELVAAGQKPSCLYSQLYEIRFGQRYGVTTKAAVANYEDMFDGNVVGNQIFAPRQHYLDAGLFRLDLPAWQDLEFFMRVLRTLGPARLVDKPTYNFDNSPRGDRVSMKSQEKMRQAFDLVNRAHSDGIPRRTQLLYLQLFRKQYGIKPSLADYRAFTALGLWPRGLLKLVRATLRN